MKASVFVWSCKSCNKRNVHLPSVSKTGLNVFCAAVCQCMRLKAKCSCTSTMSNREWQGMRNVNNLSSNSNQRKQQQQSTKKRSVSVELGVAAVRETKETYTQKLKRTDFMHISSSITRLHRAKSFRFKAIKVRFHRHPR